MWATGEAASGTVDSDRLFVWRVKAKYGQCLEIEATDFGVVQTLIGRDLLRFTCASGSHRGKSGISCSAGSRNVFERWFYPLKV